MPAALMQLDSVSLSKFKLKVEVFPAWRQMFLKQLDERIQASVASIQQLRKENEQLAQKLAEAEKRYADAAAQVKQLNAERAAARK